MWSSARSYAFVSLRSCRLFCSNNSSLPHKFTKAISDGPGLSHFIESSTPKVHVTARNPVIPYFPPDLTDGGNRRIYIETYGCQMNFNDTEIVRGILKDHNYRFTEEPLDADVIFLMTCAIREGAEGKIWKRLNQLRRYTGNRQIGLLGCMAERLKEKAVQRDKLIDIVAGPDSYRSLPTLLAANRLSGQSAYNVLLSLEETYQDVHPDPVCAGKASTFVSIMRGCDNMCSYCIVPFTRGRERSRPVSSIVDEVKRAIDNGIREITLLGQNVNSYVDSTDSMNNQHEQKVVTGFKTLYKPKKGSKTFGHLLDEVAAIDPEVRIRFTSPHPKDFPDEVLDAIARHENICKCLHLPAQSGSNSVLERMRRGYTKEAYLELVDRIKSKIPSIAITSDFICGFCGETEEEHAETVHLVEQVGYSMGYIFAYSMRERTHAHYTLKDDVPYEVKTRRVAEVNELLRSKAKLNNESLVGSQQLVLVEGTSFRSLSDLQGRCDRNTRVVFPADPVIDEKTGENEIPQVGDYVSVQIESVTSQSMRGVPVSKSSIAQFSKLHPVIS